MRVEEVKEKVIEYLRENGSANVSELMRYAKCGKATIYKAIRELEENGVIKTRMVRNRRLVYLVEGVPSYLKYLTAVTLAVLSLAFVSFTYQTADVMTVNLSDLNNSVKIEKINYYCIIDLPPLIFLMVTSVLIGYWLAVLTLKYNDIVETVDYIKSKFNIKKLRKTD